MIVLVCTIKTSDMISILYVIFYNLWITFDKRSMISELCWRMNQCISYLSFDF